MGFLKPTKPSVLESYGKLIFTVRPSTLFIFWSLPKTSSVKYPEQLPARRSSKKKKKEKVSKSCCRNWLQRNFQLPLNPAEMEPPAVGDDDSEFILSAVSLTRRLYVKFRCRLKTRNPFACPGNAQCCSWTYRGQGGDPTGLHSWEQPPEEPPVLQLDCWKRWEFLGWFVFKCKHLKASLVEAEPSKSENLIIF